MGPEIQVFSIAQACHVTKVCLYLSHMLVRKCCHKHSMQSDNQANTFVFFGFVFSLPGTLVNVKKKYLNIEYNMY